MREHAVYLKKAKNEPYIVDTLECKVQGGTIHG